MQSLNVAARTERTNHAQQGMVKKSDIFPLFQDWRDINTRSVALCIIIPIFLELRLVDYFTD